MKCVQGLRNICCILFCLALLGTGCIGLSNIVSDKPPVGCENSLIYKYVSSPGTTDLILKLALYELAKNKPEWREPVWEFLLACEKMITLENITYRYLMLEVVAAVDYLNENAGVELLILSEVLGDFDKEILISDCDKDLLLQHIAKQKLYLGTLS